MRHWTLMLINVCLADVSCWLFDDRYVTQMMIISWLENSTDTDSANALEPDWSYLQRSPGLLLWPPASHRAVIPRHCRLWQIWDHTIHYHNKLDDRTGCLSQIIKVLCPNTMLLFFFQCFRRDQRSLPPRPRLKPGASPQRSTRTGLRSWGCWATSPSCSW